MGGGLLLGVYRGATMRLINWHREGSPGAPTATRFEIVRSHLDLRRRIVIGAAAQYDVLLPMYREDERRMILVATPLELSRLIEQYNRQAREIGQ